MTLIQKRMQTIYKYDGRDRLSEMPDEVIVHILSCLPAVDAVRTVLLRRFGNLWTLVHTLRLDVGEILKSIYRYKSSNSNRYVRYRSSEYEKFFTFVSNVLMLHKGPSIHKFLLSIKSLDHEYLDKAADHMMIWLRVAMDKQAKEIEFSNLSGLVIYRRPMLPNFISRSLVALVLIYCEIMPELRVNLGSLKKLSLYDCNISDETFQRFIFGCPSLQELCVEYPYMLSKLSFSAPNVDKLSLSLCHDDQPGWADPFLVECPNIKTLDLVTDGWLLPEVIDVSSVRHVNIKYSYYPNVEENKCVQDGNVTILETFLTKFLTKFESTQVFQLSCMASEQFLHTIQHVNLLQFRWKRVVLELRMLCQRCLLGIFCLMSSLEHLEELIIYTVEGFKVGNDLVPLKPPSSSCEMPQLKTITLHGHVKTLNDEQRVVESLLKGMPFLDKLVIVPIDFTKPHSEMLTR